MDSATARQARLARGWSIMEVQRRTGLNRDTISDFEKDKGNPHPKTIEKLTELFGDVALRQFRITVMYERSETYIVEAESAGDAATAWRDQEPTVAQPEYQTDVTVEMVR